MHKVNPDMPYLSLASASDMPCYWWNADSGRFRIRDLVNNVSEIAVSVYHYDNPGGLPSIPTIVNRARRFAVGKDVGIHLIGIWGVGTLIELYRYGPVYMRDWQIRLDVLLAAAAGSRSLHFFSGLHIDGQNLYAAAQGMAAFASIEDHIRGAVEADDRVQTAFIDKPEYTLAMSANPIFGQKLLWHGEPEMQTYQMLRLREDGKLVLMFFNFMDVPARQKVSIAHTNGRTYRVSSLLGPTVGKDMTVAPEEGFEWVTAPQDVHVLLLAPVQAD